MIDKEKFSIFIQYNFLNYKFLVYLHIVKGFSKSNEAFIHHLTATFFLCVM